MNTQIDSTARLKTGVHTSPGLATMKMAYEPRVDELPFAPTQICTPSVNESRLLFLGQEQHMAIEQFRLMAGRLNSDFASGGVLLISSAVSEDGKTLTAANLSFALAERSRTLLVELDLRRPTLKKLLALESYQDGIVPMLRGRASCQSAVAGISGFSLQVALCTEPTSDVRSALQSPALNQFIHWARTQYQWVILDTPPVVPISDVLEIAPHADAVVMVARARHTPVPQLRRSIEILGKRIRYTVLNDEQVSFDSSYPYLSPSLLTPRN